MLEHVSRQTKVTLSVLGIIVLVVLGLVSMQGGPTAGPSPVSQSQEGTISMEDAQAQFKAIQDKINSGAISLEEATKQLNVVASKLSPPPLPLETKAQGDQ